MKKSAISLLVMILCCLLAGCRQEETPVCSHRFTTRVTKEATCQGGGTQEHICQQCGLSVVQATPAVEHSFTETVSKESTCSEEGVLTRLCTICGVSEETPVATADHTFDFYSLEPSRCTVCAQIIPGGGADPLNPWYGKTWFALGTSLSSEEQGTYVAPLAERSGMNAVSLGIPEGTAIGHVLYTAQNADFAQADLITVEFGVNDWFENVPLGTVYDTVPYLVAEEGWSNEGTVEGTFAGACYQIFSTLQKRVPNAVIIFLTDSTGQENCGMEAFNEEGLQQQDYAQMAMAVAQRTGVRVIDAGSMSMINQYHPQYLADQFHHSELGGKQYALAVWMELKDIAPLLNAE